MKSIGIIFSTIVLASHAQVALPEPRRATLDDLIASGIRFTDDAPVQAPSPTFNPAELGMLARWRYDSCMKDAAKAPTEHGVNVGLTLCRRKFNQVP